MNGFAVLLSSEGVFILLNKVFLYFQDWADLIEYVLRKCTRIRIEHSHNKERKDPQKSVSEPTGIELT